MASGAKSKRELKEMKMLEKYYMERINEEDNEGDENKDEDDGDYENENDD